MTSALGRGLAIGLVWALLGWNAAGVAEEGHAPHWGYQGAEGPEHWADLSGDFKICREGRNQSPVDITAARSGPTDPLEIDYRPAPLSVINNGHTIQVNVEKGSAIRLGGKAYDLLQYHFHSPSEHTINGKAGDLVVHLVHKSADGQLAVIGVLMNRGKENAAIRTVWANLPAGAGKEKKTADVKLDPALLLPKDRSFYQYTGSLTTPPCTEGVNWLVMKKPLEVSSDQVRQFVSIFPLSVRPVQPLNDRTVRESP